MSLRNDVENAVKGASALDGIVVAVYKPAGISSFQAVARIRRAAQIKRVGHAGTLDPFAEGVLVVGIGRTATRQLGAYLEGDKEYQAQLVLGKITDSYDLTGKVVEARDFVFPSESQIREALDCFRGEIMQTPPPFSAVKVGGVRLYRAARKGVILEAKPRKVRIEVIELTGLTNDGFVIQVVCSHGTYIRSLAHQIGLTLGCGAHLTRLVRTRVGAFTLDRAEPLEQFISRLDFERTTT